MASYTISYDYNSVTFTVTECSALEETHLWFYIRLGDVADSEIYPSHPVYAITSDTMVVTLAVEPETYYACTVFPCYYENGQLSGTDYTLGGTYFTTPAKPAVVDWDWTISNGAATAEQTQLAYSAITSKGKLSDFSYLVWNDLVNKCEEAITNCGGGWVSDYGTISETLMTLLDRDMTADRFNSVWWQCFQYIGTEMDATLNGYCPVSRGDVMNGSYFIDLANAINDTIHGGQ